jgi:small subunit ribosomal protein S18
MADSSDRGDIGGNGDSEQPRTRFGAGREMGGPGGRPGGRDRERGGGGGRPRGRYGRPPGRRKEPVFADNEPVDYKDIARLRRCLDEQGKILPRRRTGNSARIQRQVTVAIKRARHVALLPFVPADRRA